MLVHPESELLTNEMADMRLNPCVDVNGNSRECLIGPDEVSIAQLQDNVKAPEDSVVLQVNGVPVLVHPESELLTNEVAAAVLNPCVDVNGNSVPCQVGPDEVNIAQIDDTVTLQVNGVPVLVHPESELLTNEAASLVLNPCVDVNGNSRACSIGPDDVSIAQLDDDVTLQINGVPVLVHPESELLTNEVAAVRLNPCVDVNGNSVPCQVGPDEINIAQIDESNFMQKKGVPVLVNPESELLKNDMASARLNPCETPEGLYKKCEIGADEVVVLQVNGVPVLVHPESELLTN